MGNGEKGEKGEKGKKGEEPGLKKLLRNLRQTWLFEQANKMNK